MDVIRAARLAVLNDLLNQLEEFIRDREYRPEPAYVLYYTRDDNYYCRTHAHQRAAELIVDSADVHRCGSHHDDMELTDTIWQCWKCGCLLHFPLTIRGAMDEIHHFIDQERRYPGALLPEEAFLVGMILTAFKSDAENEEEHMVDGLEYRNAITYAQLAIAAIKPEAELQMELFACPASSTPLPT